MISDLAAPLLGALLLVLGGLGVVRSHPVSGAAPAGWGPDPTSASGRRRFWDGAAWTPEVRAGGTVHGRGRRLRGRFWGIGWVLPVLGVFAVVAVGAALWLTTRADTLLVGLAVVAQLLICLAFYRFVDRQLGLGEEIGGRTVVAATVAGAGAALLVAHPLDDLVVDRLGVTAALGFSGPIEEPTKLLVPVAVFVLVGRWRTPRAGLALGLASGFGFGVAEGGLYAVWTPSGESLSACGPRATGPAADLAAVVDRLVLGEALHWLLTGFVCVVVWRRWHRHGAALGGTVVGAVALAMGLHSLNDVLATAVCGPTTLAAVATATKFALLPALYLLLRAAARGSLPPARVDVVSRGWHPRRLATDAEQPAVRDREPVS